MLACRSLPPLLFTPKAGRAELDNLQGTSGAQFSVVCALAPAFSPSLLFPSFWFSQARTERGRRCQSVCPIRNKGHCFEGVRSDQISQSVPLPVSFNLQVSQVLAMFVCPCQGPKARAKGLHTMLECDSCSLCDLRICKSLRMACFYTFSASPLFMPIYVLIQGFRGLALGH
jgi:hypothetical protein